MMNARLSGPSMICPICQKRKAKRFCPARDDTICSVDCGTEREVTIDCPSDCPHLIASRAYDYERQEIDWPKMPFRETRITAQFVSEQKELIDALAFAICSYAAENHPLVDADAVQVLGALVETYRTLSSGIYYEKPPDYRYQRELYDSLKAAIGDYRATKAQRTGLATVRDSAVRDALIFFAQLGYARSNGRPKGRAFLDLLRREFAPGAFEKPASNIVLLS